MVRILVIDDDQTLTRLLQLELHDYDVTTARDGLEGMRVFDGLRPDLVVLDIGLPLMDGRAVCQRIREISDVPILMMTANPVREEDIAHALNLGADEFMRKPLPMVEFQARLRALLRRTKLADTDKLLPQGYKDSYLAVDVPLRSVTVNGEEVRLTPTEFKLLALFVQHPGEVLTFQQLLESVWGFEYRSEHHYPRIYVSHLRRKIEADVKNPLYIQSEYGIGYRFVKQNQ
ncbi:MAG TPA: response regulator transcription factor [Phototrophicaceae bacterium]|nr:response regulator transcription factor [Phototrophicaceae bacterium]